MRISFKQSLSGVSIPPSDCFCKPESTQDRLLNAISCSLKQTIKLLLMEHRNAGRGRDRVMRHRIGGRKGQGEVAAAVVAEAADSCQPGIGTSRQPVELRRKQWRIGGHNDDYRAPSLFGFARGSVAALRASGVERHARP